MPAAHAEDLPHALVTGFGTRGPRVTGFDFLRKALAPADGEPLAVWQLAGVRTLPDGADLFRIGLAEPDAHAEVSVEGRTLCYPARPGEEVGAGNWQRAVALALITGVREDLAPLVLTGPAFARPDGSAFRAYREALHTHLTCNDAEAAAQRTLEQDEKAAGRRTLPRSTASQNACAETASGSAACRGTARRGRRRATARRVERHPDAGPGACARSGADGGSGPDGSHAVASALGEGSRLRAGRGTG
ncbi:hypothetical protein ACFSNO_05800 [Streptomyces cirratus]